jgi:dipeptidyl aminopeptidase/acylaminoacyl peptidase
LQVPDSSGWKTLLSDDLFDSLYPVGLDSSGKNSYIISNIDRDRQSLQALNLSTGETSLIYEHKSTDIGWAKRSRKDNRLLMAYAEPDYPEIIFFASALEKTLKNLTKQNHSGLNLRSIDNHDRFATLTVWDHSGSEFLLMDLKTGTKLQLGISAEKQNSSLWSEPEPVKIPARDGLKLKAYLTLPMISNKRNLPTVLLVHGGPWSRDWWGHNRWGHNRLVQFLANKGYAVLQINYRGSRGYGRTYMEAAIGEFSGKVHDDLIDGVNWAINEGISDPDKIAIVGGSYGGYATLVGMNMTPDQFACGIYLVGVSDLASLVEDVPPYWKNGCISGIAMWAIRPFQINDRIWRYVLL